MTPQPIFSREGIYIAVACACLAGVIAIVGALHRWARRNRMEG